MRSTRSSESLASSLADRVRRSLAVGRGRAGDRLMTEGQLATRYGVSRSIAREAVSRLRGLGLVDSRQRRGIVLCRPDPVDLFARTLPFVAESDDDLLHLSRLRYVLEIGAIDLAVMQATAEQARQLRDLAVEYAAVVRAARVKRSHERQAEVAFHGAILAMSASPMVAGLHRVLLDYFQAETRWQYTREEDRQAAADHIAIAEAVERQDVELARSLLRRHLMRMPALQLAEHPQRKST